LVTIVHKFELYIKFVHVFLIQSEADCNTTLISKLDLAEQRRKSRISSGNSNNNNNVGSDSDGEDGGAGSDTFLTIWITKGPPAQLDTPPGKLRFLRLFGLTTIAVRNGELA
jgi:hypothetical protein